MPTSGCWGRSSSGSGTKSERSGCSRSGRSRRWIGSRRGSGSGWGSRREWRDRRLRRLPREGTKRFSPYGQGLRAGRAGLRRVLRPLLRRDLGPGGGGPGGHSGRAAGGGATRGRLGPPGPGACWAAPGLTRPYSDPGGGGNGGPARGVREPARPAAHRAGRAAREQAAVRRAGAGPRPARALAAALVRHPPARRRGRRAVGAGAAGPRLAQHDAGVYSYVGGTVEAGVSQGPSPGVRDMTRIHSTTILCVRRDGHVALGGDGQVTLGDTVMKANANKVRALKGGKILAGFAGASADAFTLFEKFEEKLERYPGNLPRAAVELAKDWRSDRVLRRLEALLVVADKEHGYVISGSGGLIAPDDGVLAIGSGGGYAPPPRRARAG